MYFNFFHVESLGHRIPNYTTIHTGFVIDKCLDDKCIKNIYRSGIFAFLRKILEIIKSGDKRNET